MLRNTGRPRVGGDSVDTKSNKEKNSLDSDEEDQLDENGGVLNDEDIEGQEDATIDHDGEIQITPFNMKDEMEGGHFDRHGTFVFAKKTDIKDNWIDNVDWMKIAKGGAKLSETQVNDTTDELSDDDYGAIYAQILELIKPGETILKAVRRLGGKSASLSASQRWGKKKQKSISGSKATTSDTKDNSVDMLRLTELADKLIQDGNMDTYEATYEKVAFMLKKLRTPAEVGQREDAADDALDMFAEALDGERGVKRKLEENTEEDESEPEVLWMYKWENTEDAEIHGPVSSSQMLEWSQGEYFSKGAYCRKVNSTGDFNSTNRIDFELYT